MSDVIDIIKRLKPASLKVTMSDGTERPVAVPKAGNRWSRVAQILESVHWVTVECLDGKGSLLGPPIEAEDDEAVEELVDEAGGSVAMARVMLDVMRGTMKETRLMFDAQLRGQAEMMTTMTDGMRHLSEVYRQALAVQQAHLMAPAAAGAEPEGQVVMKMMQMAMLLMNQPKIANPPPGPPKKEG